MMKCLICNKKFKVITATHLKKHGITVSNYRLKYGDDCIADSSFKEKIKKTTKGKINVGEKNAAKRPEIRLKISQSVKKRWKEGSYDKRINGMLNKTGKLHPNYDPEKKTLCYLAEHEYVKFLSNFQDVGTCLKCGRTKRKINIHHIDENHSNFLISNLEPLCVPCHSLFHYSWAKTSYITIVKEFSFASAHWLPFYKGPCNKVHGHEWTFRVGIKKRIDPKTGMVMDFSDLKRIVNYHVVDVLDHDILNRFIENPTAENISIWIWENLMFDGLLKGIEFIQLWESKTSYVKIDIEGMLSIFKTNIESYLKQKSICEVDK